MPEKTINDALITLQSMVKAPKSKNNDYGGYKYRSAEDILEAVKPHLRECGVSIVMTDDIIQISDRFYVRATATLHGYGSCISAQGWAREALTKKGMDEGQITGSTSSYARKYALCGLLCIDNGNDLDDLSKEESDKPQKSRKATAEQPKAPEPTTETSSKRIENIRTLTEKFQIPIAQIISAVKGARTIDDVSDFFLEAAVQKKLKEQANG